MQFLESLAHTFLASYGWEGTALAGILLVLLGVQLHYYIFVYGRIPNYKNNRREEVLDADPRYRSSCRSSRKTTDSWRNACR